MSTPWRKLQLFGRMLLDTLVDGAPDDGSVLQYNAGLGGFDAGTTISATLVPRRGTAAVINLIVLAAGEIATTSDTNTIRIGDGVTAGGTIVGSGSSLRTVAVGSSGTGPVLTNGTGSTPLDFSITDPTLVLDQAGTWLLLGAATLTNDVDPNDWSDSEGNKTASFRFRRTNNTAANLSTSTNGILITQSSSVAGITEVLLGGATGLPGAMFWGTTVTANTNDSISICGSLDGNAADGGNVLVNAARILAIKIG